MEAAAAEAVLLVLDGMSVWTLVASGGDDCCR